MWPDYDVHLWNRTTIDTLPRQKDGYLARRGNVAYQLELPENLCEVHNVFHISQLRKCISPPHKQTDHMDLELSPELTYKEKPLRILEESERRTRNKVIKFYRVQWDKHSEDEATWEREDSLREEYPYLFEEQPKSRDEISLKGGRFVTTQDLVPQNFIYLFLKMALP